MQADGSFVRIVKSTSFRLGKKTLFEHSRRPVTTSDDKIS